MLLGNSKSSKGAHFEINFYLIVIKNLDPFSLPGKTDVWSTIGLYYKHINLFLIVEVR